MIPEKVRTFGEFIQTAARLYKKRTAIKIRPRFRALSWTYDDLFQNSVRVAQILKKNNVKKGDRVLLWSPNSHLWVATFFGILLRGAVVVPMSIQNTDEFVGKVAKQTDAKLIIKSFRFQKIGNVKTLDIEDISLDSESSKSVIVKNNEDDLAEIVYTSGTTGEPKGVMLTHKNILSNVKSSLKSVPVDTDDRFLSILPLSHMFEQVAGLFAPLFVGAQITYATALNSISIRKNLIEDKVTKIATVPEFLKLIIKRIEGEAEQKGKKSQLSALFRIAHTMPLMLLRKILFRSVTRNLGRLHTVASGGAPLEREVGEKWEAMGVYVLQGYGATECSPVVTVNSYSERKIDSAGKPLESVDVRLADDGEILVKGPNVSHGYYKNPEKTEDSFVDGWYKTGDAGYFDKDGFLYIKGRTKYMIVSESGLNVYPEDIEFLLNKMPGVEDSCVLGLKRTERTEIHAVLLGKNITNPSDIIDRANQKLASYQQIQGYSLWSLDDFPRTVTRKIKKEEVIAHLEKISAGEKIEEESKDISIVERSIAQVTGMNAHKITDDKKLVADLKLDSLSRVELVSLIEETTGVIIDESEIDTNTTVNDIKHKIKTKAHKIEKFSLKEWPLSKPVIFLRSVVNRILTCPIIGFFADTKVEGLQNLKGLKSPVVFFSNHISTFDAPSIVNAMPDHLRKELAMATADDIIFQLKQFKKYEGILTFLFNIYPFARTGQVKSSLEYTGRLIDRGFSILFFPEGEESKSGKFLEFKTGSGLIAVEMGIPVVPIKITGTNDVLPSGSKLPTMPKRRKVIVKFGKPIIFAPDVSYIEATKTLQRTIEKL